MAFGQNWMIKSSSFCPKILSAFALNCSFNLCWPHRCWRILAMSFICRWCSSKWQSLQRRPQRLHSGCIEECFFSATGGSELGGCRRTTWSTIGPHSDAAVAFKGLTGSVSLFQLLQADLANYWRMALSYWDFINYGLFFGSYCYMFSVLRHCS